MKKLLFFVDTDDIRKLEEIKKAVKEKDSIFLTNNVIEIYEIDEDNSIRRVK